MDLAAAIEHALEQHARNLTAGAGCVELPAAIACKLPNPGRSVP